MPNLGSTHLFNTIHPARIANKIQMLSMIIANLSLLAYVV